MGYYGLMALNLALTLPLVALGFYLIVLSFTSMEPVASEDTNILFSFDTYTFCAVVSLVNFVSGPAVRLLSKLQTWPNDETRVKH